MFESAKLAPLRTLELPATIADQFAPGDRFMVWREGDTVHFKRFAASPLQAVEDAPDDQAMTLDEINEIVHTVRKEAPSQTRRVGSTWNER